MFYETSALTLTKLLNGQPKRSKLEALRAAHKTAYGSPKVEGDPCWTLNKRLPHLTSVRGDSFD